MPYAATAPRRHCPPPSCRKPARQDGTSAIHILESNGRKVNAIVNGLAAVAVDTGAAVVYDVARRAQTVSVPTGVGSRKAWLGSPWRGCGPLRPRTPLDASQ